MKYWSAVLLLETLTGPMWAVTGNEHAAKLANVLALAVKMTFTKSKCDAMSRDTKSKTSLYTWVGYNDLPVPSEENEGCVG